MSIEDFPQYNWDKCQNGELRYVNKDAKQTKRDGEAFEVLQDQYLERFGFGEQMERYLMAKRKLVEFRLAFVLTGNRMLLNQIEIQEINVRDLDPTKVAGMTTDQACAHIFIKTGARIDKKAVSVVEFREIMEEYKRTLKAA